MRDKHYRVWLGIEEIDREKGSSGELVEQVEIAVFPTIEEALTYRYEISQKYSPKVTGESEAISQMTLPETYSAGD
jgi:hypothetical protein